MQKRVRRTEPGPDGDDGDGSGGEERDGDGSAGISEKYAGVKVKVRHVAQCPAVSIGYSAWRPKAGLQKALAVR